MGDWGINVQGLCRNTCPFFAWRVGQCAHVVAAIGQLDQDHPYVARHGQQHLAKRFGLVFFTGVELQFVEFGQTIHQLGHRRAKALDQLGFGDAAVFQRVVQQSGHQGLGVKLPFGTLGRHGNWVGDVGFAAVAQLSQMGFVGKTVGQPHLLQIDGGQIVQSLCQGGKARRRGIGSRRAACGRGTGWGRSDARWGAGGCVHPLNIACSGGNASQKNKSTASGAFLR